MARPVASGEDYEYETTADVFQIVRCDGCGLHYLNPRPSAADLPLIYPSDYYSYNYGSAIHPLAAALKAWLDGRKLSLWLRDVATAKPRFLDVGCGDGRYLRMLYARGVPRELLWGTELDPAIVAQLAAEGYQAREGAIEAVPDLPTESFDLIVLLQVLEHCSDPMAVVRRLAALLAPGGTLVIETPNVRSLDFRLFRRRYWGGYHFPRHWYLFSPRTLNRLIRGAGLRVVRVRYLPAPTFWLYSLHHLVKYGLARREWSARLNPLRNVPLLALVTGFDLLRASLGSTTSNMQFIVRKPR